MIKQLTAVSAMALVLAACASVDNTAEAEADAVDTSSEMADKVVKEVKSEAEAHADKAMDKADDMMAEATEAATMKPMALKTVLAMQSDEAKARYTARRPAETLELFGIEPGMTVVEALPGGGWYSKILLPYLGPEGELIAGNYPDHIWARFGFGPEFEERQRKRTAGFVDKAAEWAGDNGAAIGATTLTTFEGVEDGTVDAVLYVRALHNLNRFSPETGYMDDVLASTMRALKPGGVVGVVQHRALDDNPDEWADGSAGYLKQQAVIDMFTSAGFVLQAASELNANAKDKPTIEDRVWRLPPSLSGTEEGTPEREAVLAVGESDRMTLVFRKPS